MQTSLQNIVQYFSDAAESFVKVQYNTLALTTIKILKGGFLPSNFYVLITLWVEPAFCLWKHTVQ